MLDLRNILEDGEARSINGVVHEPVQRQGQMRMERWLSG